MTCNPAITITIDIALKMLILLMIPEWRLTLNAFVVSVGKDTVLAVWKYHVFIPGTSNSFCVRMHLFAEIFKLH